MNTIDLIFRFLNENDCRWIYKQIVVDLLDTIHLLIKQLILNIFLYEMYLCNWDHLLYIHNNEENLIWQWSNLKIKQLKKQKDTENISSQLCQNKITMRRDKVEESSWFILNFFFLYFMMKNNNVTKSVNVENVICPPILHRFRLQQQIVAPIPRYMPDWHLFSVHRKTSIYGNIDPLPRKTPGVFNGSPLAFSKRWNIFKSNASINHFCSSLTQHQPFKDRTMDFFSRFLSNESLQPDSFALHW